MNFLDPRLPDRFWDKAIPDPMGGCWLWIGSTSTGGYGNLRTRPTTANAHAFSYATLVGPVPDGLELDHLCRVRSCVNPAHLEPVPRRINTMRGDLAAVLRARADLVTHCPRGHEYTPENTRTRNGCRECKECGRQRCRARRQRHHTTTK